MLIKAPEKYLPNTNVLILKHSVQCFYALCGARKIFGVPLSALFKKQEKYQVFFFTNFVFQSAFKYCTYMYNYFMHFEYKLGKNNLIRIALLQKK